MVICGEIKVSESDKDSVINPTLIVEILSKSTGEYDRGDKFYKYRQIESFKEYVLVNQEKAVVEVFYKKENKIWEISRIEGLSKNINLQSIGVEIKMSNLYLNVNWNK
jgi:Uma2 family endonuclease